MKAIIQDTYGPPDVLELADVETPPVGPLDVLVRVHAAAADPGVWHLVTGLPYLTRVFGYGLRRPKTRIRGLDLAGLVEAVGDEVTEFEPGDEVFGTADGAFAEYARTGQDRLAGKPTNVTFEQAAAVPTSAFAALQGLRDKGDLQPGQQVLIVGAAGGVGSFAVQLAKALGAEVTGVCSRAKTNLVRSIGADDVIDYTREDIADGGRRYDLILDTAGRRRVSHLRRALKRSGTLVLVGGEGGGRWLGGTDRQLRALALSPFVSQSLRALISVERKDDLRFVRELIEDGRVTPVIDRTYQLDEVPDAVRYVNAGRARGKVLIKI